ncbi:unnamed protein product [marine sediment metagenome]|uniref:Uncharacterized protein n=1 Tax=marine sediment metagenome TaxID=412755 RepID=X1JHT9_9ZZZZ
MLGRRSIQTLRKLAIVMPNRMKITIKIASITVSILYASADKVNKAYDIGILDKVFIAVPGLAREAKQFAQRQRIKAYEAEELESSS